MALRTVGCQLNQAVHQIHQASGKTLRIRWCSSGSSSSGISSSSSGSIPATAARSKKAEQMTDDELKQALPSMLFTTGNLIWSTTLAVGVAAGGLLAMFWVGSFITGAAKSLKHLEEQPRPAPPPLPPKSLRELIAERKAELEAQLQELQQLPRTPDVKQALAEVKAELRQYRTPAAAWWRWW